jgi:hypothetical protein
VGCDLVRDIGDNLERMTGQEAAQIEMQDIGNEDLDVRFVDSLRTGSTSDRTRPPRPARPVSPSA